MISIINKELSYEKTEGYKYPIRSINDNLKYHIPNGCHRYPRIEKPEDKDRGINFFKTIEDAKASGLDICEDCKSISERSKLN